MASASLLQWQTDRMPRLVDFENQCAASLAIVPPKPNLIEENLRGYVLLLSAHFQGFCRDLHTECAQIIVTKVRSSLRAVIQDQFIAHRRLDHGNPNIENLRLDFEPFGYPLDLVAADSANAGRLSNLGALNRWRNVAAHYGIVPANVPLNVSALQAWRNSCDGLATSLDGIMYNTLRRILRRAPWIR